MPDSRTPCECKPGEQCGPGKVSAVFFVRDGQVVAESPTSERYCKIAECEKSMEKLAALKGVPAIARTEYCFERPPSERIDDILNHRKHNVDHLHMRYAARRDFLQLCCEIDYLRAEVAAMRAKAEALDWLEADMPTTLMRYRESECVGDLVQVGDGHTGKTLLSAIQNAIAKETRSHKSGNRI